MRRRILVGLSAGALVALAGVVLANVGGGPAAATGDGPWKPLGHGVSKRCDGHTAIYVYDATSSKGGIAVTSWSAECP